MPKKPKAAPEESAPVDTLTGDLLAAAEPQQPGNELVALPPAERAAVAIKSESAEKTLRELMKKSADIKEIKDAAGRAQAHRMAMDLKNARVDIKNAGEVAREDANAFSRAVVAEVARLAAISKEEEDRVFKLRDDFDTEQARIAKEEKDRNEARIAAIRAKIDAITALPVQHANSTSAELNLALKELALREATTEEFAELTTAATDAINAAGDALVLLYRGALAREEAEAKRLQEAEEERQRIAAEKEANRIEAERLAAEKLKAEQAAQEVARAEAELVAQQAQQKRTMDAVKWFGDRAAVEGDARRLFEELDEMRHPAFDEQKGFGAGAAMVTMARDMAIKTLEQRLAQAVAEELPAAHAEALEMNAQFDSKRAMADAVTTGTSISKVAISDSGEPVVTHIGSAFDIYEPPPAPAPEPTPEPAPLPLPEAYSPVDELIDMAPSDGPTDAEILELVGCEYGWDQGQTIRRLQVVLANYEVRAAA